MEIFAKDNKLKAALEDEAVCKKRLGAAMSKKLTVRLVSVREVFWSFESLVIFCGIPVRFSKEGG